MTELENYIRQYFEMSSNSLNKVTALFEKEHLRKGDYFVRKGHRLFLDLHQKKYGLNSAYRA